MFGIICQEDLEMLSTRVEVVAVPEAVTKPVMEAIFRFTYRMVHHRYQMRRLA
jgi:hypothetical protein